MKKLSTRTSTKPAPSSGPHFLQVASHISAKGAVAVLLHGKKLTPSDEEHLVRCDACRRMMVEAAAPSSPQITD
jgi:hypothetical protein